MAKKKTSPPPKNDFASKEDFEICSFTSEPVINGECISSFSFDDDISENVSMENIKNDKTSSRAVNTTIDN